MSASGTGHDADVIVVGAGPAGAVSALLLARAGHDVLLLDRHVFPRPKPCGDCLSAGAVPLLERLGLLDRVLALPHVRLQRWRIAGPDGRGFEAEPGLPALSIERAVFDDVLLRAALDAGVRFLPGCRVQDLVRDDTGAVIGVVTSCTPTHATQHDAAVYGMHARLVIGADGLRSVVASRLGAVSRRARLRKVSMTFHVAIPPRAPVTGEMHSGDGMCVGIAPVAQDGRTNVTVVVGADRHAARLRTDAAALAADVMRALPGIGRTTTSHIIDALPSATLLTSGPFDRPVRRVVFDGAALVGDAAGYFDPFTGQGVYQALASAELLAPVASAALRDRSQSGYGRSDDGIAALPARALQPYADARARLLRGPRLLQYAIEHVLARPALARAFLRRIAAAPQFARAIVRTTGDLDDVSSLLSPAVLSSLLFPPRARSQT